VGQAQNLVRYRHVDEETATSFMGVIYLAAYRDGFKRRYASKSMGRLAKIADSLKA
jgi:hypothetical protein